MNWRHPPVIIWQEWAREKCAFVFVMSSTKFAAKCPNDPLLARLSPDQIVFALFRSLDEPVAVVCDISEAMQVAKQFDYVIAQIYGLSDAMFDSGMRPGGVDALGSS